MSLFKPIWRKNKKTEIKIDELNEHTDILDSIEKFNNVLKNPLVTVTKEETLDPDLDLIQTDPYPLYINTKTNDMYISYDNKKTFEKVDVQKTFDMVTGIDLDTATIIDATGPVFYKDSSEIDKKTISTINLDGQSYDIKVPSIDAEIQKIWERLNTQVSLVHNCANCGATLELEENKAIIHCKYCGSTYIVGPARLNSHY